jgi:glycosyltransferase A (GT-A) superfamily protein (DUF2064 family)
VRRFGDIHPVLAYTPVEEAAYFQQAAPDFECIPQEGAYLGERLDNVLIHYLNAGYSCVAVMNSDSPTLPLSSLAETFAALSGNNDVVLGPCDDGGYYLIGLKRPHPDLLRQVKMSTPHVLSDTLRIAKKMKLRVYLLPTWYDVDDPPSLEKLSSELDGQNPQSRTAFHTRSFLKSIAESFSEFSDDH